MKIKQYVALKYTTRYNLNEYIVWFCIVFILAMLKVSTEHIIENKENGKVQQIQNCAKAYMLHSFYNETSCNRMLWNPFHAVYICPL